LLKHVRLNIDFSFCEFESTLDTLGLDVHTQWHNERLLQLLYDFKLLLKIITHHFVHDSHCGSDTAATAVSSVHAFAAGDLRMIETVKVSFVGAIFCFFFTDWTFIIHDY